LRTLRNCQYIFVMLTQIDVGGRGLDF
jgi:hypothetical protein